ncbi:hypothetical protein FRC09_015605 [Ceratobasidium sp. 395]|nr:hypothetical protein FRC09_015605 [Ceratobasidium sp. 395]
MAEPIGQSGTVSSPIGEGGSGEGTRENRSASRASNRSRPPSRPASVHESNLTGISPITLDAPAAPPTSNDPLAPTIEVAADPHRPIRHSLRRFELNEVFSRFSGIKVAHISLVRSLTFGVAHIMAIGVLLGLASRPGSARSISGEVDAGQSQWEACHRSLAAWDIVWAVKAAIGMGMAVLDYRYAIKPWAVRMKFSKERDRFYYCAYTLEFLGLVWFIVANILLYGSRRTCRLTSPYIWWLTFGLLCWGYLVALELVVQMLGYIVWILGTSIVTCIPWTLRRNSAQTWPQYSDSGTSPMPRELVDRIPLAVYIPAVVQDEAKSPTPLKSAADGAKPNPIHPPKPDTRKRTRIKLFLSPRKKAEDDPEAIWEKAEHPFVSLEPNRAVCAICRVDFEPPRRVGDVEGDAEAESLRLFACGHVFHMECVDPWLVEISGRCPTCQRRVELGDLLPEKPKRWLGINWDVRTWFRFRSRRCC